MRYDPETVRPMREELVRLGAEELLTVEDVDRALSREPGTTLLVINSVCGCAAAMARPSPDASPVPIIARPISRMTERTSAKSRLIRPSFTIRSVMHATPE